MKQPPPPSWKIVPDASCSGVSLRSSSRSTCDQKAAVSCTAVGDKMDSASVDTRTPTTGNDAATASTAALAVSYVHYPSTAVPAACNSQASIPVPSTAFNSHMSLSVSTGATTAVSVSLSRISQKRSMLSSQSDGSFAKFFSDLLQTRNTPLGRPPANPGEHGNGVKMVVCVCMCMYYCTLCSVKKITSYF